MREAHTIIWDWNGTLLDDVDICISSMNRMLAKRNLPILDLERYMEVFTFPVYEYYQTIGFDFSKESWDIAAHEFIELYIQALPGSTLSVGASDALEFFKRKGFRQAIISAMQHDALMESVDSLGIRHYLDYIGGIGNHYGAGKIENARNYFSKFNIHPEEATLLGDSLHDAEVADKLGIKCILIASGHQSYDRLCQSGHKVVRQLTDVLEQFNEQER